MEMIQQTKKRTKNKTFGFTGLRRMVSIFLTGVIFLGSAAQVYGAPSAEITIIGESAILMDAASGKILYEKNIHQQHYPASTTKIMTAILALENLKLQDTVDIDAETPFTGGSRIYLLEGEEVTVEEVLYGLMLESANDAAVALAKNIKGSVEEFATLMNEKAADLGAKNTHFVNPNGLHDPDHLSTAYDLAVMARYAMKNGTFRDYVSTYQYTMEATNLQETRYLYNTNRLLYDSVNKVMVDGVLRPFKYDGITGIKTGYTPDAGGCLVASAKRGDTELIAVSMESTDDGRFADCIALLDYGFENYRTVGALSQGDDLGTIQVKRGSVRNVTVTAGEDIYATLPVSASSELIRKEVDLYDKLEAPVEKGDKAGVVKIFLGDELIGEYDAVAVTAIEKGGLLSYVGIDDKTAGIIHKIIFSILAILALLCLLLTLYILVKRQQIKRRRIMRMKKKESERRMQEHERLVWEELYRRTRQG